MKNNNSTASDNFAVTSTIMLELKKFEERIYDVLKGCNDYDIAMRIKFGSEDGNPSYDNTLTFSTDDKETTISDSN